MDTAQGSFKEEVYQSNAFHAAFIGLVGRYLSAHKAEPLPLLFGIWSLSLSAKPNAKFGLGRLWIAKHVTLGVVVGLFEDRVIFFSASLPRILHGANHHLINSQAEIDAALKILADALATIFDLRRVAHLIVWKRIDLVQSLPVPLDDVKLTLRYARHRCAQGEPTFRSNSIDFNGPNIQIFGYGKEEKEGLPCAGTRTRLEVRLKTAATVAKYPGLAGPGLRIDFDRAREVYREIVGKLPTVTQVPLQGIYSFLAAVAASDRLHEGIPLLDTYFRMVCKNKGSVDRTRREVAKRVPIYTKVNLVDLVT